MANFNFTDPKNPKIWDARVKEFVPYKDYDGDYDGTDALGDFKRKEREVKEYSSHTSGASREKLSNPRYDLMPARIVNDAYGRVAEFGAKKYAARNWEKGLPVSQISASLQRHLWAYMDGENKDEESKLSHLDHVLWNAVALLYNEYHNIEDDRVPVVKKHTNNS